MDQASKTKQTTRRAGLLLAAVTALLMAAPAPAGAQQAGNGGGLVPVQVKTAPFQPPAAACSGAFVAHDLPHITTVAGDVVQMFAANGAGVAVGDLDGDGLLDIVLGNEDGPDSLLWNQGGFQFRKEEFSTGKTRDVKIVDVDGDGQLDIVLTRNTGTLNYFHNLGGNAAQRFARETLRGVVAPAYVINWTDLYGRGRLDLVTGTYDAGMLIDRGSGYLVGGSGGKGVFLYTNQGDRFAGQPLARESQALAILFPDLNGDGRPDILVGNDFLTPDMVWMQGGEGRGARGEASTGQAAQGAPGDKESGATGAANPPSSPLAPRPSPLWQQSAPFSTTTHSTMSFDQGDVDNDGAPEIFATDMKPYGGEAMGDWAPMMEDMMQGMTRASVRSDRQEMANQLQFRLAPGRYVNLAPDWGVDGTGWSWSGEFGDLDNDGWLDLYIVNGMIEERLFSHLPKQELVEKNQAFHNEQGLLFRPATGWRLDSTASGRGMVMADLDNDGRLDIVVNNLRAPAQLFANQLCAGDSLEVDLRWTGSANPFAIGAQVILHTSLGPLQRDMRVGAGYLSGDPPRLHFGFPVGTTLDSLEVIWPDGQRSVVEKVGTGTVTVKR